MPKRKKRQKKIVFVILPIIIIFASLILTASFFIYKNSANLELEANITNGKFDHNEKVAYFMGKEVLAPTEPWSVQVPDKKVLSAEVDDDKWIEIDLTNQKLRAWKANQLAYEFNVSTGKKQWGAATPVGVYRIWIKLKSTKMSGGSGSTYYYLPNVQCTQYFYKGYGIHGCYWHNNYGHPMSHGCVNMSNDDACKLFYWTSPPIEQDQAVAHPSKDYLGTKIVVHGETPLE